MSNIFKIFANDIKGLLKNKLALAIAIGVCILPSLYAWFNIYSNWDPYGNTSNIKVAVASLDEGYTQEDGTVSNMGEEVIENLKENDAIDWQFVDSKEAVDGVYSGEYYAAIVIGEDFSSSMFDFAGNDLQKPHVTYYENQKKNAVASKITDSAKETVQKSINQEFVTVAVETVMENLNDLADDAQKEQYVKKLIDKLQFVSDNLEDYMVTLDALMACNVTLSGNLEGASEQVNGASGKLKNGIGKVQAADEQAKQTMENLSAQLDQNVADLHTKLTNIENRLSKSDFDENDIVAVLGDLDGADDLLDQLDSLMNNSAITDDATSESVKDLVDTIRDTTGTVADELNKELEQIKNNNNNGNSSSDENTSSVGTTDGTGSTTGEATGGTTGEESEGTTGEATGGTIGDGSGGTAGNMSEDLKEAADKLQNAVETKETVNRETLASTAKLIDAVVPVVEDQLQKDIDTIKANLSAAYQSMIQSLNSMNEGLKGTGIALDSLSDTVAGANGSFAGIKDIIASADEKVLTILAELEEVDESEQYEKLIELMASDGETMGEFFSEPVKVNTVPVYEIENYGSSVAPFYTILALWVGATILVSIMKVEVEHQENYQNLKPYQIYFGRFLLFFVLGQIQALVIVLGDLYLLKIQCLEPGLFYIVAVFASFTFNLLIYTLTVSFGDIGKAFVVVVMVLQIAGSSGTYPIEILPKFNQVIYVYFPFPYAINAMRETIGGMYSGDYWLFMGELSIFVWISLAVGLLVRKPFMRINHYVEQRMKDTKMM